MLGKTKKLACASLTSSRARQTTHREIFKPRVNDKRKRSWQACRQFFQCGREQRKARHSPVGCEQPTVSAESLYVQILESEHGAPLRDKFPLPK